MVSGASWLLFTGVHALCVVLPVRRPGPLGSCSPVCTLCEWCCVYGVLGLLAPVQRCARSVCGVACTAFWASRLLFTGVHALCAVLCARCPGRPGSCSPVCTLCVWCCVYGVLGLLAPVHRCARSVCGVACTVSGASWLLFTGVHALCVVLRVRCPGPPGSCSPVCRLCVWWCVYGVLGLLAPVHRCASSVCGGACTVSWASWLLFTGVHALCVVLRVRRPGPPGSCSPVCTLCAWCCVCLLALLCWCARVVCVMLCVWCPGTLCSCSPVSRCVAVCVVSGVRCCVCGVLGLSAPVHRCARPVCGVVWAVSWAAWLLFTGVRARCVVWCVRCGCGCVLACAVCLCGVLCGVCGVLGHLAPVHRCARVACVVFGVLGPVAPVHRRAVCLFGVLCVVCGVLGHVAPVHRCVCSVCCVVCAVWVGAFLRAPYRSSDVADSLFLFTHFSLHIASYGVLLLLPVLDSLILATPKSKRVLMHAWRCMLFTRWFVDSLHFATPKSRRVCLMHS